jgi:hypothetical protein
MAADEGERMTQFEEPAEANAGEANAGEANAAEANAAEVAPVPGPPAARPPVPGSQVPGPPTPAANSASPVAAALAELDSLPQRELSEHPEAYQRIHAELQSALATIDNA